MINKDTVVQIERVILKCTERAENLPEDTKKVPLKMRVKGKLLLDSNLDAFVKIITQTNRIEEGYLIMKEPYFEHSYGLYVKVLEKVKEIILFENEEIL